MPKEQNIVYCKNLCNASMFGSISDFADKRETINDINKNLEPLDTPINILTLLKRYPSTHLSVIELLKIILDRNDTLHSFAINDAHIDNYLEFYCKMFYSWFIPTCSVDKATSI